MLLLLFVEGMDGCSDFGSWRDWCCSLSRFRNLKPNRMKMLGFENLVLLSFCMGRESVCVCVCVVCEEEKTRGSLDLSRSLVEEEDEVGGG